MNITSRIKDALKSAIYLVSGRGEDVDYGNGSKATVEIEDLLSLESALVSALETPSDSIKRAEALSRLNTLGEGNGVPSWDSHGWAAVVFCDEKWFGVREGWKFRPYYDYKGFPTFDLLRDDGAFLCYGTYDGDWEDSYTKRPEGAHPNPELNHGL